MLTCVKYTFRTSCLLSFTVVVILEFIFKSFILSQEENGGPYKASVPLKQATNPAADVLLAYEMNGEVVKLFY